MLQTATRNSHMQLGEIYFWTATINAWQPLLQPDSYKGIVISSLEYLSRERLVDVFAFVIMPNHIHLIWRINELNGKETAQGSFLKYTAHQFRKQLILQGKAELAPYRVDAVNKQHEFWQRDPLAVLLFNQAIAFQKLDYIHANPVRGKWRLVSDPCDYFYSSAAFYELGRKDFTFLKDLREVYR